MKPPASGRLGELVIALVIGAVALRFVMDTLIRYQVPLLVCAVVLVIGRLVVFHTRRW